MAESVIPVDLRNPGQVFACLGIVEAAKLISGDAAGVFDWEDKSGTRFRVTAAGDEVPVARVLRFLEEASVVTLAPARSGNLDEWKNQWGGKPEEVMRDAPFPFPDPSSPATLPVILRDEERHEVTIDYWGDETVRDNVKFWAGAGGYPGAALLRDALALIRGKTSQRVNDPFSLEGAQSSSFRFDWRRDYIPMDTGFSLNAHANISMVGFPLVELLAAIGVSHARPRRSSKLRYHYGVLGGDAPIDPIFLRAALGAETSPVPGVPFRRFIMYLGWPGKKGQARCITQVKEERSNDNNIE